LVRIARPQTSVGISATGFPEASTPALFTRTSIALKASTAWSNIDAT
jgi:hypothetical protein